MKTICCKCKKVLTNEKGHRLHSANFDSSLAERKRLHLRSRDPSLDLEITYAWCDACYADEVKGARV